MNRDVIFGSRTIVRHIARGLVGFGFLAIVVLYGQDLGWWALLPTAAALLFLRGCPMCWLVGLIETVLNRKSGTMCVGGSCAKRQSSVAGN